MSAPITELIAGAPLKAVLLNSLAIDVLASGRQETAVSITTSYEVGVKSPDADAFFASVSVDISGVEPKSAQTQFTAKAKMTGFYETGKNIDLSKISEVSAPAIERVRMQVYPLVREILANMLGKAGIAIKDFALEAPKPPLAEAGPAPKPDVHAKKARKRSTASRV